MRRIPRFVLFLVMVGALGGTGISTSRSADAETSVVAAFPGTNGVIAFQSNRDVAANEIYTTTLSGAVTRLTFSNSSSDPAWSPDGTRIAFVSGGTGGSYQIFVMNADGTGRREVTTTSPAKSQPTWSPDGTRIAYVANSGDVDGQTDPEIWSINVDGSDRRQLTNNTSSHDWQPAWSPLGDKIAFVSTRTGDTDRNVYVMNADGTNEVNLTPTSPTGCSPNCYQGHDDAPAWSPDGSTIAYVHNQTSTGGGGPDIWLVSSAGGPRTNLTNTSGIFEYEPAWSPDGTQITYRGLPSGSDSNIYVMNADGTGQHAIETNVKQDARPDWQPIPVCTQTVNANNDPLVGTAGRDVLCGDSRNNTINGRGGNDIILGRGGSDRLTGGPGNDTLNGGTGIDTVIYSGTTAVTANLTTGFATGVGSDVLLAAENLTGSGADDHLTGSAVKNVLVGGNGADTLIGLAGTDVLKSRDGVSGNDTLDGGDDTDTCTTDAGDSITSCP